MKTANYWYEIHYRYKKSRYWLKRNKPVTANLPSVVKCARNMAKEDCYSDIEVVQVKKKIYIHL